MATAGEMVMTAAGRMPKPGLMTAQAMLAEPLLSFLGIWDAEVYEGEVHHGFDTDCAGFYPLDESEDEGGDLAGLIDPSYGGKIVRFIVLPPREKEEE